MSKTVILVCAHKRDACLDKAPYLPVQVGHAIAAAEQGQVVNPAADPGRSHAVVPPVAPGGQLVAENPGVGMADQDVLRVGEQVVKGRRKHHPVVTRYSVAAAQPLRADGHRPHYGKLGRNALDRHIRRVQQHDRMASQNPHGLGERRPLLRREHGAVNGNQDFDPCFFHHLPLLI